MPARRYTGLQIAKAGTLLALEAGGTGIGGDGPGPAGPGVTIHRYDIKARKSDTPLAGVNSFVMSSGGDKALYRQGEVRASYFHAWFASNPDAAATLFGARA